MNEKKKRMDALRNNKGVTAVFVLFMLAGLIGVTVLAIDVGYIKTTRNELQNIADAGALAGAGHLGSIYLNYPVSDQSTHTFTLEEMTAVAAAVKDVAQKNRAGNEDSIAILDSDIIIGKWDSESKQVNPTLGYPNEPPDAVRVTARRSKAANSQLTTFFAKAFNAISTFTNNLSKNLGTNSSDINMMADPIDVGAVATAALTGVTKIAEGELNVPIALSQVLFTNDDCPTEIIFQPENACSGWHDFLDDDTVDQNGTNPTAMTQTMLGLIEGHICEGDYCSGLVNGDQWLEDNFDINKDPTAEVTPIVSEGDYFEFNNGPLGTLFNGDYLDPYDGNNGTIVAPGNGKDPAPFQTLFDYFRYRDGDENNDIWTATIPIYKEEGTSCDITPNGNLGIIGFATIEIYDVMPPPDKSLKVDVHCEMTVIEGRGGGATYGGLKGSIPNLVE